MKEGDRVLAPVRGTVRGFNQRFVSIDCDDGRVVAVQHIRVKTAEEEQIARCGVCGHWRHLKGECTTCAAYRYAADKTQQ